MLPTVNHARNKRCLVEVFKCQNGLAARLVKDYFKKILHHKATRGNNKNLLLPKVRTEAGRKSVLFLGSKLYNKLLFFLMLVGTCCFILSASICVVLFCRTHYAEDALRRMYYHSFLDFYVANINDDVIILV